MFLIQKQAAQLLQSRQHKAAAPASPTAFPNPAPASSIRHSRALVHASHEAAHPTVLQTPQLLDIPSVQQHLLP